MTWDEITALIAGAGPAHVATADASGAPHVAIVAPAVEGDGLWFMTRRSSAKAADLLANPRLSLMWEGNSAETYLWGTVEVVDDLETRERVWHAGLFPYDPAGFFGSADNPDVVMFRVTPTHATAMVAGDGGPQRRTWSA